ncbi:MAG: helix-turn-helix domain-containing protein [Ruminococcaceae bacterium]|nr:helix-turn-helix domain-containing protein [Oscillospiraceae bacterium]
MNDLSRHGYLHKEDFLKDRLVFINQSIIDTIYRPEIALPHMHIHDFVELSVVISGEGYHRTLNDCSECFPGDVYVINAGAPHAYYIKENGPGLVVQNLIFDPPMLLEGELGSPDHPRYCCGLFREDPMIAHVVLSPGFREEALRIMDRMEKEQARKWLEWEVSVKAHLLDFLIMCSRRISYRAKDAYDKPIPKLRDRQIAMTVMRTVLERYNEPEMTLERIADEAFISKSHLSYIFQQVTGMRFSDYVSNVRLEQTYRLLSETKMTNEQICHACGFRDLPSFYRFFQTHAGMTPAAYRKQNKPKSNAENTEK